jgi:hypothetical protein
MKWTAISVGSITKKDRPLDNERSLSWIWETNKHHYHGDDNEMSDIVYSEIERLCLARIQLLNNGYEPIPTRGKRPAAIGWTTGDITEDRIGRETGAYPDALNTGLRTGRLVGIDIDIVDQDHVNKLLEIVVDKIGHSPLFRYGSKGIMVCCQNREPISKLTITGVQPDGTTRGVEILGQGNQFIAFGIHPDTGTEFEWVGDSNPMLTRLDELPVVTPDILRELATALYDELRGLGYTIGVEGGTAPRDAFTQPTSIRDCPLDDDDIKAKMIAAVHVLVNDLSYQEWINVGQEIWSAFHGSSTGYNLWHEFSRGYPGNTDRIIDQKWKSFGPGARTYKTLFFRADQIDPSWRNQFKNPERILPCESFSDQCKEVKAYWDSLDAGTASPGSTAPSGKKRFTTRADHKALPPPQYVVQDLIPLDGDVIIYAPWGHLKSFVALDLAFSIATACKALGLFHVPEAGPVIYFAAEGFTSMVKKRATAWEIAHGYEPYGVENNIYFVDDVLTTTDDSRIEQDIHDVEELLEGRKCKVFIIDTMNRALNGQDEDKAHVAAKYLNIAKMARKRIGGTSLTIAHAGKDLDRGIRGSSAWGAGFDTIILIDRHEKDETTGDHMISFTIAKQKDDEDGQRYYLRSRLISTPDGDSLVLDPMEQEEGSVILRKTSRMATTDEDVISAIRLLVPGGGLVGTKELARQIAETTHQKLNTVEQALARNRVPGKPFHRFVFGDPANSKWCIPGMHMEGMNDPLRRPDPAVRPASDILH